MFSRLVYDSFQNIFTVIAFVLIAGGFLFFVIKALFMKKKKADRLASMPLDEEEQSRPNKNDSDEERS